VGHKSITREFNRTSLKSIVGFDPGLVFVKRDIRIFEAFLGIWELILLASTRHLIAGVP
jgi:hypothetical protein